MAVRNCFLIAFFSGLVRRGVVTTETSNKMPYSVHHQTTTLVLLLRLSCAVYTIKIAQDGTGIIFPTEGLTLHYNDNVLVDYISNFTAPYLKVWCQTADGGVENKFQQQVSSFNSTATVKLNWTGADTPCWFNLMPDASNFDPKVGANSPGWAFDITQRAATTVGPGYTANTLPVSVSTVLRDSSKSSTSTAISTTSVITNTSSTTTLTSVTPSSTGILSSTTPTMPPRQSSGLSAGAQAGIGVGTTISGICIGAAAVFIRQRLQRRRKERKANASWAVGMHEQRHLGNNKPQAMQQKVSPVTEGEGGYPAAQELDGVPGLHEMPTRQI